jgi:uncharacterized protein (DUF934 family)
MTNTSVLIAAELVSREGEGTAVDERTNLEELVTSAPSAVFIDVPAFTDGKVFSISKQLRYLGFTGEIIVSGNFLADQVGYLSQCGVTTFIVNDDNQREEVERLLAARIDSYHFQERLDA